jgi:hypothetical protein
VTLQITTEQTVQASLQPLPKTSVWPEHLTALATLLLLPVLSRRARRRLRKAQSLFWLLVIGIAASMFSGCGGGSGNNNNQMTTVQKTPPGTYTVTVVATSGAISHSTDVTLTVQ